MWQGTEGDFWPSASKELSSCEGLNPANSLGVILEADPSQFSLETTAAQPIH